MNIDGARESVYQQQGRVKDRRDQVNVSQAWARKLRHTVVLEKGELGRSAFISVIRGIWILIR